MTFAFPGKAARHRNLPPTQGVCSLEFCSMDG